MQVSPPDKITTFGHYSSSGPSIYPAPSLFILFVLLPSVLQTEREREREIERERERERTRGRAREKERKKERERVKETNVVEKKGKTGEGKDTKLPPQLLGGSEGDVLYSASPMGYYQK